MPCRRWGRTCRLVLAGVASMLEGGLTPAASEPVTTIRNHGDPANRVDLVILGDGYTDGQRSKYVADAERVVVSLFAQEPLRTYQRYFNVHRIDVRSAQSGADHPGRAPPVFRETALDATYDCAGIQRLICVDIGKVNDILTASLPPDRRDLVLVLVNDPEYGGSGGAVAVASLHAEVVELVLHELGHVIGLLADEYGGPPPPFCDASVEPPEANATQETQRRRIKWAAWIDPATPIPTVGPTVVAQPGLYEGARYCDVGLFRPTHDSKMRTLDRPFEQVNSEQLVKRVYNWVSPIDGFEPVDSTITLEGGRSQTFRARTPRPLTHALDVVWRVDGTRRGTGPTFTLSSSGLAAGLHTVEVRITDPTPFVRSDPAQVLSDTARWAVRVIPANRSPDATRAQPSLARIWPPNHRLVPVQIVGVTDPDGDPVQVRIDRIMQDEPSEVRGSGRTCPDADGIGTATGHLRAERSGKGDGRVYAIFFTASDGRGLSTSGIVRACVPHSNKRGCVDDGPSFDSTACRRRK